MYDEGVGEPEDAGEEMILDLWGLQGIEEPALGCLQGAGTGDYVPMQRQ